MMAYTFGLAVVLPPSVVSRVPPIKKVVMERFATDPQTGTGLRIHTFVSAKGSRWCRALRGSLKERMEMPSLRLQMGLVGCIYQTSKSSFNIILRNRNQNVPSR